MLLEVSPRLGLALEVFFEHSNLFWSQPWSYRGVLGLGSFFQGGYDRPMDWMGGYDIRGLQMFRGGYVAVLVKGQHRRLEVLLLIHIQDRLFMLRKELLGVVHLRH